MFRPKITNIGKFVPRVLMFIRADLSHDRTRSHFGMVSEEKSETDNIHAELQTLEYR